MTFGSFKQALSFYRQYASDKGFDIRKVSNKIVDGVVIRGGFKCSRAGYRTPHKPGVVLSRRSKDYSRCGCEALLYLSYCHENLIYRVTKFNEAHTHPLETPETSHVLKSNRKLSPVDKYMLTSMQSQGIRPSESMHLLHGWVGRPLNLSFTPKDGYNYLNNEKLKLILHGDVKAALCFLDGLRATDPNLFVDYTQSDIDGSLTRLFWADGFSRSEYSLFGSVVCFDSTFRTNHYRYPLVVFSGVDNHLRTCVFGAAIMYNETTESYCWLLRTFQKAMQWSDPISILTDQDASMAAAIEEVFPNTKHRLCSWHLTKNCVENVKVPGFADEFKKFMSRGLTVQEFECKWHEVVTAHNLQNNSWVKNTYNIRDQWSEAYCREFFMGMMRSTQRSEWVNSFLKKRGPIHGYRITQFLKHYFCCLAKIRNTFRIEQALCQTPNTPAFQPTTLTSFQEHAAATYTRKVFWKVSSQIFDAQGLRYVNSEKMDDNSSIYIFRDERKTYCVQICLDTGKFECDCLMLESEWIPCSHLIISFHYLGLKELPSQCIYDRWTIDVGRHLLASFPINFPCQELETVRINQSLREFMGYAVMFSQDDGKTDKFVNIIKKAAIEIIQEPEDEPIPQQEELNEEQGGPEEEEVNDEQEDEVNDEQEGEINDEDGDEDDDEGGVDDEDGDEEEVDDEDGDEEVDGPPRNAFPNLADPHRLPDLYNAPDPGRIRSRGAPPRKPQKCGRCHKSGHKRTTCKELDEVGPEEEAQFV